MAKKKHKRSSRTSSLRPAPPLSSLDKSIYLILAIFILCLTFAPLIVVILFQDDVVQIDPTVVISMTRVELGLWIVLSLFTVGLPLVSVLTCAWVIRQPFFGRGDVLYGFAGGREEIYPLFGKYRHPQMSVKGSKKKEYVIITVVITTALALSILFPGLSLFGRVDLHDNMEVTVKNGFNVETRCYGADEIEAVTFALESYHRRGRKIFSATVIIIMGDGRKYEMVAEPSTLLWVKEEIRDGVPIDYRMNISVNEYVKKKHLNQTEADILQEVFTKT